ncbi:DUF4880 domain-containing protein [Acinetobacter qingfengensis]|uniref:Uncharacterized protein n=1 Tax=Acinetobacter qingfengensis TaxID=1262585 RepID=A0A1E7R922_9GAMM|nr:FecR domain-containing protein [Acinetobacter qingfengensis]KAA8735416.1 DUF4880 domain-containing protein [Acinetobacter qingfengensis]OEY95772.1 hypothetical protein BJI46_12680 [Acinetobacter qingfengensis]
MQSAQNIAEQAAEWVVKLSTGQCTNQDLIALEQWKQQSPEHLQAFEQLYHLIQNVQSLQQHNLNSQNNLIKQYVLKRKRKTNHHISLLLLVFIMGSIGYILPWQTWTADVRNDQQVWQQQKLQDNSLISISGKTAYNIQYSSQQRKIELLHGNILVDVAKDKHRPFIVDTGNVKVQALGTRFIVQHHQNLTIVSMLESKTQINSDDITKTVILKTGETLYLNGQNYRIQTTTSSQMLVQAWQHKKLVVNNMPLSQVLEILQSYQRSHFIYSNTALENDRVTAVLPLDQPEVALQLLQQHHGLKISHYSGYITRIEKN